MTTATVKLPTKIAPNIQVVTTDSLALKGRWNKQVTLAVDAEWRNALITQTLSTKTKDTFVGQFLTSQFAWHEHDKLHVLVIWHPDYPLPTTCSLPEAETVYVLVADPETTNPITLGMTGPKTDLKLLMFASPHDVRSLVGKDIWIPWLIGSDNDVTGYEAFKGFSGTVTKKRKLNGVLFSKAHGKITLYDVIGTCTAGMGLDMFHESVGINSPYKSLSKSWDKSRMEVWMGTNPSEFLQYAIGDVLFLEKAMTLRVAQVNQMIGDALGFNPNYIEPWLKPDKSLGQTRFPMSAGSLVSTTFEKWLEQDAVYNRVLTALAPFTEYSTKQGQKLFEETYLKPMTTGQPGIWKGRARTDYDSNHPLTSLPNRDSWQSEDILESYHPISASSVPAQVFYHSGRNSSGVLNAIVYGGRCVNERPNLHCIERVLDIDLNSCYGSALEDFTYPIGFPRVLKYASSDTKRMKLREFLKKYEHELVDNCYQIYVSGKLTFEQDLIASKIGVDEKTIIRKLSNGFDDGKDYDGGYSNDSLGRDVDKAHIPGEMVHLLSECVYSVITSDILQAIKTAPNLELKGFMNLTVDTATYYAKSDMCSDVDQFESRCKDKTPMVFVNTVPVTPNVWFPVPMKGFVGQLVATRKRYKDAIQVKRDHMDLLQNGIKLFINTTYGCMASPFFRMGNTVLANNITAKARLGAWMMAKALGSVQSITDGGMYSAYGVRTITGGNEGRLPGFNVMADYERLNSHRGIAYGPIDLGEYTLDFEGLKVELHKGDKDFCKWFETKVLAHINKFWGHYGMTLPFNIEHKYENTCDTASYDGSANYLMIGTKSEKTRTWEGIEYPYTFKCRGVKDYNGQPHNKEMLLWSYSGRVPIETLLLNKLGELEQATSKVNKLIQTTEWQQRYIEFLKAGLLPGDSVDHVQIFRPNELHKLVATQDEYRTREKSHNDAVRKHDRALETLGYIGRQFGMNKHKDSGQRGVLGKNFPDTYNKLHIREITRNTHRVTRS